MASLAGTFQWYAVKVDTLRTGYTEILYVYASSAQQALNNDPGSTLLGGPYASETIAENAFPQGSSGTITPPAGEPPPSISDTPDVPSINWEAIMLRVGEGLLGIVLIGVGVSIISSHSAIVQQVAKKGIKAAEVAAL